MKCRWLYGTEVGWLGRRWTEADARRRAASMNNYTRRSGEPDRWFIGYDHNGTARTIEERWREEKRRAIAERGRSRPGDIEFRQ